MSDLGVAGALALLTIPRNTGDDLLGLMVGLADHATDASFDFAESEHSKITCRVEAEAFEALRAKTLAIWDKLRPVVENALARSPHLDGILTAELEALSNQVIAGIAAFKEAGAAELGLTVEDADYLQSAIDGLKEQGVDQDSIGWALVPDFLRLAGEPRPTMPPLSIWSSKVNDVAIAGLRRIEEIIGRNEGDRTAEAAS
jgi:hypothetical protein